MLHGGGGPKAPTLEGATLQMPHSTLLTFGVWEVTGAGGGMLHGVVVVAHEGVVEVYDLASANASKSTCQKLRKGGVAFTLHTSPSHCNQKNCLYTAVRLLLWHLQHPTGYGLIHPSI